MPTVGATTAAPEAAVPPGDALALASAASARGDRAAVGRALASLTPDERPAAVRALTTSLINQDFEKAERWVAALPVGPTQNAATEVLARSAVDRDPSGAVSWAHGGPSPSMQSTARQTVAARSVELAPKPAMARLLALPASPARLEMLGYAAAAWTRLDPAAALAWMRTTAPATVKDHLAVSMAFALAQTDPARAADLLGELPLGRDRLVLLGAIGQTWIARDANQAWQWARQLPAGSNRDAAFAGIETGLGGAGSRVARSEPAVGRRNGGGGAAEPVANALPLGPARDEAFRREFDEAMRESPARAADWLRQHPGPDRSDAMVNELMRRWLPDNPAAAKTWINENIYGPGRREELLREYGQTYP